MNKHPEKLYKYRPWNENTKQLLLNNQIYIPSPETFNDPFENELKINFNLLNEDQYRIKYVDFLLETYRGKIEKLSLDKSQLRDSINKTLLEDVIPLHKEHRKIIRKIGYKNWGIFCSSEVSDNILMWSHYAQSHLGICIEYDFNSLSNLKIFKDGSQVFYNSRYPTIDPLLLTSNEIPLDIKMLILYHHPHLTNSKRFRAVRKSYNKPVNIILISIRKIFN